MVTPYDIKFLEEIMISNPGFTFTNINGIYKIAPIDQTDMDNIGPLYSEVIICEEIGDLVTVYSDQKGLSKAKDSVALSFANININNNDEILKFITRYGLPGSERNFANERNDYLFWGYSKDEFTRQIPLVHKERDRLTDIKKSIIAMKYALDLSAAIADKDYQTILKIITFFCTEFNSISLQGKIYYDII